MRLCFLAEVKAVSALFCAAETLPGPHKSRGLFKG